MTENINNTPSVNPIESNPGLRARTAGFIGRLSIRGRETNISAPEYANGLTVNDVLNTFDADGIGMTTLDPEGAEAGKFVDQIMQSPKLDKQLFLPSGMPERGQRAITIDATPDKPIELPLQNFVYAPGLTDWTKGREDTKPSQRKIRSYARKNSQAPPIGMVSADVQPDGTVLFSAIQDGAHRIAAAKLRGDKTISVGGTIAVNRLSQNIL